MTLTTTHYHHNHITYVEVCAAIYNLCNKWSNDGRTKIFPAQVCLTGAHHCGMNSAVTPTFYDSKHGFISLHVDNIYLFPDNVNDMV